MTSHVANETDPGRGAEVTTVQPRRSRRSLLAALGGGLAGVLGGTLSRPPAADAADGDPVLIGRDNVATSPTSVRNRRAGGVTLRVRARGQSSVAVEAAGPNVALSGDGGRNGTGVSGMAAAGTGVNGHSVLGTGVSGNSGLGFGVEGGSRDSTGVQGTSRFGSAVVGGNLATDQPAVAGWAQGGHTGVRGFSSTDVDVKEPSSRHTGVHGACDAPAGTGVLAQSRRGTALRVEGRASFSRSGVLVVRAGQRSAEHRGITLTGASLVFANLRQHRPGLHVEAVVTDPARDSFTVHLSAPARADVEACWFVVD